MTNLFEGFDKDELIKSAEKILESTGNGAKKAYAKAKDDYDGLSSETKKAIVIGVSVFAIVLAVAGCFYLLGKRAGKKEKIDFEYEEWDA